MTRRDAELQGERDRWPVVGVAVHGSCLGFFALVVVFADGRPLDGHDRERSE